MPKNLRKDQLSDLIECLQFVEDPRVLGRSKHLLIDILVISVCACLCGAEGVLEIEAFGRQKEDWLKLFLELPNGIASHDTIARVLSLVDPVQMEIAFGEWVQGILLGQEKIKSLSLDGKSTRGTQRKFSHGTRPLLVVSAYAHELGLSLMQSESPSSGLAEAEAALDCLKVLDIKGITVMADAGIAVKKVIHQIREQKGHYIVPVKGNHPAHLQEIIDYLALNKSGSNTTFDQGHGKKEERTCRVLPAKMTDKFLDYWKDAKTVVEITRVRFEKDKRFIVQKTGSDGKQYYEMNDNETKRTEWTTYYVSSRKLNAKEALSETRKHWQIENNLHWVLDVAFREDHCTVRAKKLARSLSLVRKIALNIIRSSKTKGSVRVRMKNAGWNNNFLENLVFGRNF